jgi:pimeloyl-ACP methyl ester carboxylesterase/ketosteroid isomerase-like protein
VITRAIGCGVLLLAAVLCTAAAAQDARPIEGQHLAVLRRMIATVNAGDAAGYARLYATDALITIYGGQAIKGRPAIEQYEVGLMREFPGTRLAFYSVWQAPPIAVVHYGVNGATADRRSMGHEGLLFFRFDAAGAIVDERRYLDSATPMAQLGALGPTPTRPMPVLPGDLTGYTLRNSALENANVALVKRVLGGIEARALDPFLAGLAPTITIDELMLPAPFVGKSNAGRWLEAWSGAVGDLRHEVTRIQGIDDHVLVETIARGTLSAPIGRLGASTTPFAAHRAFVVQIKDGAIARLLSFVNSKEIAEATGQWPPRPAAALIQRGRTAGGIAYDVRGSGPVVVLLTGSNLDRRMWAREAEWLSRARTVVQYDLRAHGESDTATTLFSHLGDLIGLLDELKIQKAALVGLSAGATIALDAALEIPDRVDRIVLSGPGPSGYVPKQPLPFTNDVIAAFKTGDYRKVSEVLLATPVFAAPPESQALVRRMVTENERLWTVDRSLMKAPRSAMDRLDTVKVPTLVLIGEKDTFQNEAAELLAKGIPGARLVRVPGGGHLLNLTSPKEFQAAVSEFLSLPK